MAEPGAFEELLIEVASKIGELEKKIKSANVEEIKRIEENLQTQINQLTSVINELSSEVKKKKREKDQLFETFKSAIEEKLKFFEEKLKTLDRIDSIESEIRKIREEKEKKDSFFGDLIGAYEKEKQLRISDKIDEIENRLKFLEESIKSIKDEFLKLKDFENIKKSVLDFEKRISYLENFLKPDKILKFEQIDNFFNKELPKRLDKEFQIRAENLFKNIKNLESEINRLKGVFLSKSGEIGFLLKEVKRISDLENEIKRFIKSLSFLENKLNESIKDLNAVKEESRINKLKIDETSKILTERLEAINNLKTSIDVVQDFLAKYEEYARLIEKIESELQNVKNKTTLIEEDIKRCVDTEIFRKEINDIKSVKSEVSRLKEDLNMLQNKFEISKINSIIESYNGIIRSLSMINQRVNKLESILNNGKYLEKLEIGYNDLLKEINENKTNLKEVISTFSQILQHLEKVEKILEKNFEKIKEFEKVLENSSKDLEEKNMLQEKIEKTSKMVERIYSELEELEKKTNSLEESINKIRIGERIETLKDKVFKLEESKKEIESIIEKIRSKISYLETSISRNEKLFIESSDKTKTLLDICSNINQKVLNVLKGLRDLENEINLDSDEIKRFKNSFEELREKVERLETETRRMKSQNKEGEKEKIDEISRKIENIARDLNEINRKIRDLENTKNLETEKLRQSLLFLEKDLKNLEKKYLEILSILKNE